MSTSARATTANSSLSSTARGKSVPASESPPAQRSKSVVTPSTTSRSNPLDQPRSSPSAKQDGNAASSTKSDAKPGVARTVSASTATSVGKSGSPAPPPPAVAAEASKPTKPAEPPIDMSTFEQILELDEDDPERSFSKSIVENYHEQADTTFGDMDDAIKAEDLPKLSALGHFLKGSSAALGIVKVQETCEAMQHLGQRKDPEGKAVLTKEEALEKIRKLMPKVRDDYKEAKAWFDDFFSK